MPLSTTNCEYTTTNIPAFLSKLWTLVEDPKYNELIAWDPSGFSFHVFDQTSFSREILPRFFKHNNMASFIRQLNMYGFRKVNSIDHGSLKNEKEDMEFHHPYFIKGKEQFLEYIKRKVPDVKSGSANSNVSNTGLVNQPQQQQSVSVQYNQIKTDELNKVLDDVNIIKSKQKMVDDSLFNVKKENEALWKEIASLRQKHHHQQQIVNKLIHFLVHLVNPSTLGLGKRSRPLMIDSHSAAALVNSAANATKFSSNDTNDDQYNDIDDDEDEEFIIHTNNISSNRRQFVELEEDEEEFDKTNQAKPNYIEETESSSSLSPSSNSFDLNKNKNKKDRFNFINDTEIETINNAKTINNSSTITPLTNTSLGEQVIGEPAFKRMRTSNNNLQIQTPLVQQQQAQQLITTVATQPIQPQHTQIQQLKIIKDLRAVNSQNNMSNLFLNDTNNLGLITSETTTATPTTNNTNGVILDDSNQLNSISSVNLLASPPLSMSNTQTNSPIISMPASPNLVNSKNTNLIPNDMNSNIIDLPVSDSLVLPPVTNNTKRTISSFKNCNSNQMNDHVESLQLDLNSIKEFLSSNSFSQIDSYTINNLFSPMILENAESEPNYLEAPLQSPLISNSSLNQASNLQLPTSLQLNNNNTNTSSTTNNINNNSNNGKIVGNELIQYEPFNTADFLAFNADDLITVANESIDDKSLLSKQTSESNDFLSRITTPQLDKSENDNKWIDDNFINEPF